MRVWCGLWLAICLTGMAQAAFAEGRTLETAGARPPLVLLPEYGLTPRDLAVIVNDRDPTSQRIAEYYLTQRPIPRENLIRVRFEPGRPVMPVDEFRRVYQEVKAATPEHIQAYALAWTEPFRVGCLSITSAFAAGYDEAFCARGCQPTRVSPYFASQSRRPYADFGWRPAMALAGTGFEEVAALIDRGVASDDTRPPGTGYLVNTSDRARRVRAQWFDRTLAVLAGAVELRRVDADFIEGRPDVLFYFTGLAQVPKLATNRFRPGAVADHLTSTGGQLTTSRQMSSLRWLEAGATGSYGTVVEPCNLLPKFPSPPILMATYLTGATLIEAYWKSVEMPGQGIFIGEPLARPFGGVELTNERGRWVARTYALTPGAYELQAAADPIGPYRTVSALIKPAFEPIRIELPDPPAAVYRLIPAPSAPGGRD